MQESIVFLSPDEFLVFSPTLNPISSYDTGSATKLYRVYSITNVQVCLCNPWILLF